MIPPLFKEALENAYLQDMIKAARGLYQIYCELQKAGFDKQEAMTLLIALIQKAREIKPDEID